MNFQTFTTKINMIESRECKFSLVKKKSHIHVVYTIMLDHFRLPLVLATCNTQWVYIERLTATYNEYKNAHCCQSVKELHEHPMKCVHKKIVFMFSVHQFITSVNRFRMKYYVYIKWSMLISYSKHCRQSTRDR